MDELLILVNFTRLQVHFCSNSHENILQTHQYLHCLTLFVIVVPYPGAKTLDR